MAFSTSATPSFGTTCLVSTILLLVSPPAYFQKSGKVPASEIASKSARKIVGEDAPIGRFPYMCSLRTRGDRLHRCGATLIDPRWVVTAAHCVDPSISKSVGLKPVVYCGIYSVTENDPDKTFAAVEARMHEAWDGDHEHGNDIAMLKLHREANLTVAAWDDYGHNLDFGILLAALGWGETKTVTIAKELQVTQNLNYVSSKVCSTLWTGIFREKHMICAGFSAEDTCEGDSGGPLLIVDSPSGILEDGIPMLDLVIGITSFGPELCDGSLPGIYTRLSFYSEWIQNTIRGRGRIGTKMPEGSMLPEDQKAEGPETDDEMSVGEMQGQTELDSDEVEQLEPKSEADKTPTKRSAKPVRCFKSPLGYDCMTIALNGEYKLHWTTDEDGVSFACEANGAGWVGLAWPKFPGRMLGAEAVIGIGGSQNTVGTYPLSSKVARQIDVNFDLFDIVDTEIKQEEGNTILKFKRLFDSRFGGGESELLVAYDTVSNEISYHGPHDRGNVSVFLHESSPG